MTEPTEAELISRMKNSILEAMDACKELSVSWRKGPAYDRLRKHLGQIEDDCRVLGGWRLDERWLNVGMIMGNAHKYAGNWLRGYRVHGVKVRWAPGKTNEMFIRLGMNLGQLYESVEKLATSKTGTMNPIVTPLPTERTVTRVNGYNVSAGGVLLPRAGA